MERIPIPAAMQPKKSSSFNAATVHEEKLARNLTLGAIKLNEHIERAKKDSAGGGGSDKDSKGGGGNDDATTLQEEADPEPDLAALSDEIDVFLASLCGDAPTSISEVTLDKLASAVEVEMAQSEGDSDKWAPGNDGEQPLLLAAIRRITALASALTAKAEGTTYTIGVHRVTGVLHRAMTFLEDEFDAMLDEPRVSKMGHTSEPGSATAKPMRRPPTLGHAGEPDRCMMPSFEGVGAGADPSQPFPAETVDRLHAMAEAMIAAGYETECTQMFLVARRNALDATLQSLGYEKASIDDVVKMAWEVLESDITTWIKAFRHTINVGLSAERDLCVRVFAGSNDC